MATVGHKIHLEPLQHAALREIAIERNTTISSLVRSAIEAWLREQRKRTKDR